MRNPDTVMTPKTAWAEGRDVVMIDVSTGGSNGLAPNYEALNSSTPYVQRHLIPFMLAFPRIFSLLPPTEGQAWGAGLKALMETRAKTWEGFTQKLTPEFYSTNFGGAGEEIETVSDMKRDRSNPQATYVDLYGRPIATYFQEFMLQFMLDPQAKVPGVLTRNLPDGTILDFLPDMVSWTMLFVEPDPTFTKVDKAWLVGNMMPHDGPPVDGRRDLNSAMQGSEFSISFTNLTQVGFAVNQLAQTILSGISLAGANPNTRAAMVGAVDASVAAVTGTGYREDIAAAAATAVPV